MKKFSLIALAAFGAVTALSISVGMSTPSFAEEWKCRRPRAYRIASRR
jgi:hypothetical protein